MTVVFSSTDITAGGHPATLLEFKIGGDGNISPDEIPAALDQLDGTVDGTKGVVISGRGPVWFFGALLHHLHVTRWSATFDPRLGAVVVASHHPGAPHVGEALSLPKSE